MKRVRDHRILSTNSEAIKSNSMLHASDSSDM
jgi:hypothetical protein